MREKDDFESYMYALCERLQDIRRLLVDIVNSEGQYLRGDIKRILYDKEEEKIISSFINGVGDCSRDMSTIVSNTIGSLSQREKRKKDNY